MFDPASDSVCIPASQKHVGMELAIEIMPKFTEAVVQLILVRRKNLFACNYFHCADTR